MSRRMTCDTGVTCIECDASLEAKDEVELERAMIAAKWVIGLREDAQAYYACPNCKVHLFCASEIVPVLSDPRWENRRGQA